MRMSRLLSEGLSEQVEHRAQERNRAVIRVLGIGATSQDNVRVSLQASVQ